MSTLARPAPRAPARECLALRDLAECLLEACDLVARRAHQKFLVRGGPPGKEFAEWKEAEREVLTSLAVDVQDNGTCITALASLPGLTAAEVEVGVETRWLAILGRRPGSATAGGHVFEVVELPAEVDPARSVAVLAKGLLGIRMPKKAQLPLPGIGET